MIKDDLSKASFKPEHKDFVDILVEQGYFRDNIVCYKFFVSYGLSLEYELSEEQLLYNRTVNIFDARVDIYLEIQDVVKGLYIDKSISTKIPIRIMNALADIGIQKAMDEHWNKNSKELHIDQLLQIQ